MWNFQVSRKQHMEFPGVLVFGIGISMAGNTNFQNFQGWSFVLSRISQSKVKSKKRKIPVGFSNKYFLKTSRPFLVFFLEQPNLIYTFNMTFKVSPKAKVIINGGFIFQFHDGIHSTILPTLLEIFFRQFIKMNMTE